MRVWVQTWLSVSWHGYAFTAILSATVIGGLVFGISVEIPQLLANREATLPFGFAPDKLSQRLQDAYGEQVKQQAAALVSSGGEISQLTLLAQSQSVKIASVGSAIIQQALQDKSNLNRQSDNTSTLTTFTTTVDTKIVLEPLKQTNTGGGTTGGATTGGTGTTGGSGTTGGTTSTTVVGNTVVLTGGTSTGGTTTTGTTGTTTGTTGPATTTGTSGTAATTGGTTTTTTANTTGGATTGTTTGVTTTTGGTGTTTTTGTTGTTTTTTTGTTSTTGTTGATTTTTGTTNTTTTTGGSGGPAPTATSTATATPTPTNTPIPTSTDTPTPTPTSAVPVINTSNGGAAVFTFGNMIPGDSITRTLGIVNGGGGSFTYTLSTSCTAGGCGGILWTGGANGLQLIVVRASNSAQLYNGSLNMPSGSPVPLGTIAAGQTDTLNLTVSLPVSAGNAAAAQSVTVTFSWTATS